MPEKVTEAAIKQVLQNLSEAPLRIAACTHGLDEAHLTTPPAPNEWSAQEIMAHVRGSADARQRTIHKMLALDSPRLPYVSPRAWVKKQNYDSLSFAENFRAYPVERADLIGILQGLTIERWNRSATFTGKSSASSVFDQAMSIAQHDLAHCDQLETTFPSNKHE